MDRFDIVCIDLILKKLKDGLWRYKFIGSGDFKVANNGESLNNVEKNLGDLEISEKLLVDV